jgi:hypothetical protein
LSYAGLRAAEHFLVKFSLCLLNIPKSLVDRRYTINYFKMAVSWKI